MKSKKTRKSMPSIKEGYEALHTGLGDCIEETLTTYISFAEEEAEERAVEMLMQVFKERPTDKNEFIKRFKKLLKGE